jgi:hypothetical protein
MPKGPFNSGEITPRNIVWVEDMPPDFGSDDVNHLTSSYYTHAIVGFFHLDAGPTLVYNGPGNDPYKPVYNSWWAYLRGLRQASNPKTLLLSVGGWNSGTWANAQGLEPQGAAQIVKFAQVQGVDGIDFNFEGDYGAYTNQRLATFGRLVVEVRKIWNGLLTITPIYGQVWGQLLNIQNAVGHSCAWSDYLSWVNVQFYTYQDGAPQPMANVPADYDLVLSSNQLPASMVAAGFPLSETDLAFNQNELQVATGAVKDIFSAHPDFAGMFVWRYRGAFLGDRTGRPLNWAYHFYQLLHNR